MEATQTPAPIENEEFWRHHNQMQKASSLSRADYCRQSGLNYDRFGYWIGKLFRNLNQGAELVSIKIKPTNEFSMQPILCTLNLKGGHFLKIHDTKALSVILDKMT